MWQRPKSQTDKKVEFLRHCCRFQNHCTLQSEWGVLNTPSSLSKLLGGKLFLSQLVSKWLGTCELINNIQINKCIRVLWRSRTNRIGWPINRLSGIFSHDMEADKICKLETQGIQQCSSSPTLNAWKSGEPGICFQPEGHSKPSAPTWNQPSRNSSRFSREKSTFCSTQDCDPQIGWG